MLGDIKLTTIFHCGKGDQRWGVWSRGPHRACRSVGVHGMELGNRSKETIT